jgi:extracellular factor (EF) 3-hydroxypalmitic acid methyl ester biosynthesis protein
MVAEMTKELPLKEVHQTEEYWNRSTIKLTAFKALVEAADREALQNEGQVSSELIAALSSTLNELCVQMNGILGNGSALSQEAKRELGRRYRREVLPYLLLAQTAERWYSKPRGYAGDFMTIEQFYQNQPKGTGRIGTILDRCFLELPTANAVRNRRLLLVDEIRSTLSQKENGDVTRVSSLASGPAREIFDVFQQLDDPGKLYVTLVDVDLQALAFVSDKARRRKWRKRLRFVPGNLIDVVNGRQELGIESQDLIYSIGLIDYFSDNFVVRLLDYIHSKLRPGGRVILGNFHPRNPTRALMDYVLSWELIYRTEDEMHRLFQQSSFRRPCTNIRYEAQRINLFAECIKND